MKSGDFQIISKGDQYRNDKLMDKESTNMYTCVRVIENFIKKVDI